MSTGRSLLVGRRWRRGHLGAGVASSQVAMQVQQGLHFPPDRCPNQSSVSSNSSHSSDSSLWCHARTRLPGRPLVNHDHGPTGQVFADRVQRVLESRLLRPFGPGLDLVPVIALHPFGGSARPVTKQAILPTLEPPDHFRLADSFRSHWALALPEKSANVKELFLWTNAFGPPSIPEKYRRKSPHFLPRTPTNEQGLVGNRRDLRRHQKQQTVQIIRTTTH